MYVHLYRSIELVNKLNVYHLNLVYIQNDKVKREVRVWVGLTQLRISRIGVANHECTIM